MASDVTEEDDIPSLESLSGSESVDEDADNDSDGDKPTTVSLADQPSNSMNTGKIAVQWLHRDWTEIHKQMHYVSLYTLSPFLYGCSYQSEKWLKWLCEAQFLHSDMNFSTGLMDQHTRAVVDILEDTFRCVMEWMEEGWPPNGTHPIRMTDILDLFQEVNECRELQEAIERANGCTWFAKVVQRHLDARNGTVVIDERQPNHLNVAYLYILTNTAECVYFCVGSSKQDFSTHFERFRQDHDQQVDGLDALQNEGMLSFSLDRYEEALHTYDLCIQKYPFCSNVFVQRSLCFMALKKPMEAVSDGLRAYHLDPESDKIIDVYVRALIQAGEDSKARMLKAVQHSEVGMMPVDRTDTTQDTTKVLISDINGTTEELAMETGADQSEQCCPLNDLDLGTISSNAQTIHEKTKGLCESSCVGLIKTESEQDLGTQRHDSHLLGTTVSEDSHLDTGTVPSRTLIDLEDRASPILPSESSGCIQGHIQGQCCVAQQTALPDLTIGKTDDQIQHGSAVYVDACVQTERYLTADKSVVTDPLPPVETFKEKYEGLLAEKRTLCAKLEELEDRRVQQHKEHKRELERVQKKTREEVLDETNAKVMSLEAQLLDEQSEKKGLSDQMKSLKLEVKAHKEKADKLKKEQSKKELELETRLTTIQADMDRCYSEKKKMEDRMRALTDSNQKALMRAMSAEVDFVTFKRDITLTKLDSDLRRIEMISQSVVSTGEYHQQVTAFKEKFKAAMSTYQAATDEVIKQLKSGRELSTLVVPEPHIPPRPAPPPAHPSMHSMMMPLVPRVVPRILPQAMSPVLTPMGSVMQGLSQGVTQNQVPAEPQGPSQTVSQGLPQAVLQVIPPSVGQGLIQHGLWTPQARVQPQGMSPQGLSQGIPQSVPQDLLQGGVSQGGLPFGASAVYPTSLSSRILSNLSNVGPPLVMPAGPIHPAQPMVSTATVYQDTVDTPASTDRESSTPRKKTALDRILQILAPHYPHLSREECKTIMGNIRKQNGSTLSGHNVEHLALQIKAVLDANNNGSASSTAQQQTQQHKRFLASALSASSIEYDDDCVICYEELFPSNTTVLNCGHFFHTVCIRSWLKEQRTCPTCRKHALLPEDYPYLDQTVQKGHLH